MPRGFLVKRNKKATPVSYRVRSEEDEQGAFPGAQQDAASAHRPASPRTDSVQPVQFGNPEIIYRSMYSPTRPVSREHERACLERRFNLGSPISAESFPAAPSGSDHAPFAPVDLKIGTSNSTRTGTTLTTKRPAPDAERKGKPASKKAKAMRKLQFEDEVTTSPVLGLKIKEGPVEQKTQISVRRRRQAARRVRVSTVQRSLRRSLLSSPTQMLENRPDRVQMPRVRQALQLPGEPGLAPTVAQTQNGAAEPGEH